MDSAVGKGQQKLKIVFMGTPEFARVSLEHLVGYEQAEVIGVYTQPDRPCGRGRACKPTDVKVYALEQDIPVYQPENFKTDEAVGQLDALAPDLLVVAAYGLILPQRVLDIPRLGAINVHASLLPKYRGAAPIQRAILNGESSTGITIMQMDAGMDTGDILHARAMQIDMNDTAQTLHDDLADMGGRMLIEALERMAANKLVRIKQDDTRATYAPKLEKSEGELDWTCTAQEVHDRARAMHPWPGAYFSWQSPRTGKEQRLAITPGEVGFDLGDTKPLPGSILGICEGKLAIACADRAYLVPFVKPSGKKQLTAEAFACGYLDTCPDIVCTLDDEDAPEAG